MNVKQVALSGWYIEYSVFVGRAWVHDKARFTAALFGAAPSIEIYLT